MSNNSPLEIKASLTIQRQAKDVFEAITDPAKMTNYFISKSTGIMKEGKTIHWSFPEMEMYFRIRIGKIIPPEYISNYWNDIDGSETLVEINLFPKPSGTFVSITEKSRINDEAGINWLRRKTEGWANLLACLKAWLEYKINLNKGAFDPSQIPV